MSQRRSKVVIDGKSGKVIAEVAPKSRAKKTKVAKMHREYTVPTPPISHTALADVALALGVAEAIFETADHIADIFQRRR